MFKSMKGNGRLLLYGAFGMLLVGVIILVVLMFALSQGFPGTFGKCVGVFTIDQELTTSGVPSSLFSPGVSGSAEIAQAIRGLDKRDDIDAVVLVVNSPGGSVVATHEIYDAFKNISKPKVAYFREVAASGGYYISTPADYIISDPDALTGSIGVITTTTDASGLLEKIGLNISAVKSAPHKDIGSPYRPPTEEETAIFQGVIDQIYGEFKQIVIDNRGSKINMEMFANSTDGRIMTGRQAVRAGLVDAVGRQQDAIDKAAGLAGIPKSDVRVCDVSIQTQQSGLFNLKSFVTGLESGYRMVQLRYG